MIICAFCKAKENIVKSGFRNNLSGKKQKYQCNNCHRLFVPHDAFWKMKNSPEIIAEAMSCKKRGMSYQEVSKHFQEYDKAKISGVTVFNWVKKYGNVFDAFNKKQIPKLSGKINTDEFVFKVKKNKHYRWVSKDRKTKFRIFALSTRKREYDGGVKKMYKNIKDRFYGQFLAAKKKNIKFNFISDKLAHYKKGFNKYFYNVATLTHGVPIVCKKYKLKHNNNCIERDHQYSRKLENNTRGHKSFQGATALFNLGDIYYNFIDKQRLMHEKTWRTPAQRAGIKINFGEKYQLLNFMKIASVDN